MDKRIESKSGPMVACTVKNDDKSLYLTCFVHADISDDQALALVELVHQEASKMLAVSSVR